MQSILFSPGDSFKRSAVKYKWHILATSCVIILTILQDFIFSVVKNTGFYLSESLLYNMYWCFFPLLLVIGSQLTPTSQIANFTGKIAAAIIKVVLFSFLHTFLFTCFFVGVSVLIYSPSHYFSNIFFSTLSSYFYITIILYAVLPFLNPLLLPAKKISRESVEFITIKLGIKTKILEVQSIEYISSSKPYSILYAQDRKYPDSRSLKNLESLLSTALFIRVHRSHIINKSMVKEMHSRKNGDYDALLQSGEKIRCSRHYRSRWEDLLG